MSGAQATRRRWEPDCPTLSPQHEMLTCAMLHCILSSERPSAIKKCHAAARAHGVRSVPVGSFSMLCVLMVVLECK